MRGLFVLLTVGLAMLFLGCQKDDAKKPEATPEKVAEGTTTDKKTPAAKPAPVEAAAAVADKKAPAAEKPPVEAAKPGTTTTNTTAGAETTADAPSACGGAATKAGEAGCGGCGSKDCAGCDGGKAQGCGGAEGKAACAGCGSKDCAGKAGAGCGAIVEETPPSEATVAEAPAKLAHFGGDFTLTDQTTLSAVLAKPEEHRGKNVKVAAKVSRVCKKKGCWMILQSDANDGKSVRVTMKDYGFFVPKDCDGRDAVVEGVFDYKEVSVAAGKHLAQDAGDDPTQVKAKALEMRLVASAIDLK
ncbi:MAG: type IV secretory pathway VirB10-like protein [Myxococcota bacterium]|jgi:type IV secretory pathway VirB10-like protein